jgi:DNA-binding CsgD family transcriptional regulator
VREWLSACHGPEQVAYLSVGYDLPPFRTGVAVKILYHEGIRDDPKAIASARKVSSASVLCRTTSARLPTMAISDREIAVILSYPGDLAAGTTWTSETAIISALASLFEHVWSAAEPLFPGDGHVPYDSVSRTLAKAERELLRLLASGATDEVTARRLGVSLRTARRHVATLMSELDAVSRFQAGAEAARRGWLS